MSLAHFRMLIHQLLDKDSDIFPEGDLLIILDSKSSVFLDNNGKYTKNRRRIDRRVNFVSNVERYNMHNIEWCEGYLKLVEIATKNVG